MKTKRAMQAYQCHACKRVIAKGEQYARKTFRLGNVGIDYGSGVKQWEPYTPAIPICADCANPKEEE